MKATLLIAGAAILSAGLVSAQGKVYLDCKERFCNPLVGSWDRYQNCVTQCNIYQNYNPDLSGPPYVGTS